MNERASKEALFHVVRQLVPNASLAHTLAEALFWMQYAKKFDGDRPTIWKTGRELSEALGIHPRTANEHMKRLAELQLVGLRYGPKPGGISPVSWLTATPRAIELIERARTIGRGGRPRETKSAIIEHHYKRRSEGGKNDAQVSEAVTGIQSYQHSDEQEDGIAFFNAAAEQKKGNGPYIDEDTLEPPEHLPVSPQAREMVMVVQEALRSRNLPRWDPKSKYTWINARRFADVLSEAGLSDPTVRNTFLGHLFDEWPDILPCLPARYREFEDNALRPSPRALSDQATQIIGYVHGAISWKSKTSTPLDDFG